MKTKKIWPEHVMQGDRYINNSAQHIRIKELNFIVKKCASVVWKFRCWYKQTLCQESTIRYHGNKLPVEEASSTKKKLTFDSS